MDLKERYQLQAEEIASEQYGVGFYDLCDDVQIAIYEQAMRDVHDTLMLQAESLLEEADSVTDMLREASSALFPWR